MSNSGLRGKPMKYQCTLSGQKVAKPCVGCINPEGCLSRVMQYKKPVDSESLVKVNSAGAVITCAKDYSTSDCGYTASSKVCGKCGALAVELKESPMEDTIVTDETLDDEDEILMKALEEKADMLDEVSDAEAEKRRMEKDTRDISDTQLEDDDGGDPEHGEHDTSEAKTAEEDDDEYEYWNEETKSWNRAGTAVDNEIPGDQPPGGNAVGERDLSGGSSGNAVETESGPKRRRKKKIQQDEEEAYEKDAQTEDDEWVGLDEAEEKAGVMMRESRLPVDEEEEEEEEDVEEEEAPAAAAPPGPPPAPAPAAAAPAAPVEEAPPAPEGEGPPPGPPPAPAAPAAEEEAPPPPPPPPAPMDEEEEEEEDEEEMVQASLKKDAGAYLCAIDRKVYPGNTSVCEDCPGGCTSEKGMPSLLEVETNLELQFKGAEYATVIDSVYSDTADLFICDVDVDGEKVIEVFVEGQTGEVLGYSRLDDSVFEQKDAFENVDLVDFSEAADIATKTVDGVVSAVEPDVFEGYDCYAVEINGVDSKSYDVFVALDGEVLGYDTYEPDESEAIEAEAAEIALKRAFTDNQREELAKEGKAMKDGSYPIDSEQDLRNAVQAYGRATDKPATKAHIMKRARAMGLEEVIPANWVSGDSSKAIMSVDDAEFMASLIEFELLSEENGASGSL